jgi:hypothetical protein
MRVDGFLDQIWPMVVHVGAARQSVHRTFNRDNVRIDMLCV